MRCTYGEISSEFVVVDNHIYDKFLFVILHISINYLQDVLPGKLSLVCSPVSRSGWKSDQHFGKYIVSNGKICSAL